MDFAGVDGRRYDQTFKEVWDACFDLAKERNDSDVQAALCTTDPPDGMSRGDWTLHQMIRGEVNCGKLIAAVEKWDAIYAGGCSLIYFTSNRAILHGYVSIKVGILFSISQKEQGYCQYLPVRMFFSGINSSICNKCGSIPRLCITSNISYNEWYLTWAMSVCYSLLSWTNGENVFIGE